MKNYSRVCFFALLAVFSIALRVSGDKGEYLTKYISIINLVALFSVIISITIKIYDELASRTEHSWGIKTKREDVKGRIIRNIIFMVYVPCCILALIYFFKLRCDLGNDIISIVALFVSLSDESLSKIIIDCSSKKYKLLSKE